MNYYDLTPEQQEKAKACKTVAEVYDLIKSEGFDLTDEELRGLSGGWCDACFNLCWDHSCKDFLTQHDK
ncbi:MAG: Nif11 family protein [Eggerthellaceae bacterium]|nr:Nif11 family protein [Eggerthellaceae bacterium]